MASTESLLDVRPIDAEHSDAVWPLSIEAGWNQNVADWRFMLGAGRGFGCTAPDGTMAGQLAGPAARPEARLDQHGAGDEGSPARRCRHRPAEEVHRGGAGRRCGRGARCDGAGAADLPAARLSRSLPDRALALRRREGRGGRAAGRRHGAADHAGRPAAACHLRPAADRHGAAVDPDATSPCASPAARGWRRMWAARSWASCWAARAGWRRRWDRWSPTARRSPWP